MTDSPAGSPGPALARSAAPVVLAVGAMFLARAVAAGSAESLRAELWLTDQALGTLPSAFAAAYALALPVGAILGLRGGRMRLLAAGLALCGGATAASALADGFFWLAFGRSTAGLGAGLAAGATAGLLLRGEPARRGGGPGLVPAAAGIALGYLAGGLCARAPGWRLAFVLAGAALVVLAAACARAGEPAGAAAEPWIALRRAGVPAALRGVGADPVRALGLAASIVGAAALSALGFWMPAFLVRLQNTPSATAGGELAAAVIAAALAGTALARAALRRFPSGRSARWLAAAGAAAAALGVAAALAGPAPVLALAALMTALLAACAAASAAVAAGADADAPVVALAAPVVHGLGELAGPIAVGAFADRASLGAALVLVPGALLASALLWAASAWAARPGARAARGPAVTIGGRHPGGRAAGTRRGAGT